MEETLWHVERVGYFSSPLIEKNGTTPLLSQVFRLILFKTQQRATYIRYGLQLLARRFSVAGPIGKIEVAQATYSLGAHAVLSKWGPDVSDRIRQLFPPAQACA